MFFFSKDLLLNGASDRDYGNLSQWQYVTESNGQITLQKYLGSNWSNTLYVPKGKGKAYINNWVNATASGTVDSNRLTPFYNNKSVVSVDCQYVPFIGNNAYNAFYSCNNLVSVTNLNQDIINMANTFYNCTNFNQNIQIPSSVTNMYGTFYNCTNFNQNIQIPSSVTNMNKTFSDCIKLNSSITIGSNVTDMGRTFQYCKNFNQYITIPNKVTYLGVTFADCINFKKLIDIRSAIISEASNCFSGVSGSDTSHLTVLFPLRYINGVNTATRNSLVSAGYAVGTGAGNWANNATQSCNIYFQDYILPHFATYTGNGSAWILNAVNTQEVVVNVPSTLNTYIEYPCYINGATCFKGKTNLTNVFTFAPWVHDSAYNAFRGSTGITNVIIVDNNVTNLAYAFYATKVGKNHGFVLTITSPKVSNITSCFTLDNTYKKTVYLYKTYSNGINTPTYKQFKANTTLNNNATSNFYISSLTDEGICYDNMHKIYTSNNVVSRAFSDSMSRITEYVAPDTLNIRNYPDQSGSTNAFYYGAFAFTLRDSLRTIDLKNHLIVNGSGTFYYCSRLEYINNLSFSRNIVNMHETFFHCHNFNQPITIPSTVRDVSYMLGGCNTFNSTITIEEGVTTISYLFATGSSTSQPRNIIFNQPITIPNSVTNVAYAFSGCQYFNQPVTIPDNVTNVAYAFSGCQYFNQPVTIPDNVTDMSYTFHNCTQLKNKGIRIYTDNIQNANNCFFNTTNRKNVFIPYTYANGELTQTYNAFNVAGYINTLDDGVTLRNGVYMYNIANYPES